MCMSAFVSPLCYAHTNINDCTCLHILVEKY